MGQRTQIITVFPETFINDDIPNNKPARFITFHNQWSYGGNFLIRANVYIEAVQELIKKTEEFNQKYGFSFIDYEELSRKALALSDNINTQFQTKSLDCGTQELKNTEIHELLKGNDNNNGYVLVIITPEHTVLYTIIGGLEDFSQEKIVSPMEYLQAFYKEDVLIQRRMWEYIKAVEDLEKKTFLKEYHIKNILERVLHGIEQ